MRPPISIGLPGAPVARLSTVVSVDTTLPEVKSFLAERGVSGAWQKLTYLETYGAVRRIGQALLDRGLGPQRPVAILSDNGIDHALLALGKLLASLA